MRVKPKMKYKMEDSDIERIDNIFSVKVEVKKGSSTK